MHDCREQIVLVHFPAHNAHRINRSAELFVFRLEVIDGIGAIFEIARQRNTSLQLEECGLGRNLFEAEFLPSAIESQPGPTASYRIPRQTSLNPSRGPYWAFTGVPTGSLPNPC